MKRSDIFFPSSRGRISCRHDRCYFKFLIICWSLINSCHSLASSPISSNSNIVDSNQIASKTLEFASSSLSKFGQKEFFENYVNRHQSVQKRRSLRRLLEIGSIFSGRIFRPLLCSLAIAGPKRLKTKTQDEWDEFWSRTAPTHSNPLKLSNAQRVAQGLPFLGPSFVKLGQLLATRPDILHVPLAEALTTLQDRVRPFDNLTAKGIIRKELESLCSNARAETCSIYLQNVEDREKFLESLSEEPVASASIAQVYKGYLPGYGHVAVKVQRPGIRSTVESDATLFHSLATWLEKVLPLGPIVRTVDEFTARIFEDMDFEREAKNMKLFADLYCHKKGSSPTVKVVVPELIPELSSKRIIVMEWIDGTKLTDIRLDDCEDRQTVVDENLAIVETAIECTLSQFFDTGLLHADPHEANLLKVKVDGSKGREMKLGYLDFGLVSPVSQNFRDGVVCAVIQLVYARNLEAVVDLCVDLDLLPAERVRDAWERRKFVNALRQAIDDSLLWPQDERGRSTAIPKVRSLSAGLASFSKLISSYDFTIPPYFLNNVRALSTLEGIALKIDPNFNILRVIYPYSINQLMKNVSVNRKAKETFLELIRSPETKLVDFDSFMRLLNDWALLTNYPKRKVFWDLFTSTGYRQISALIFKDWCRKQQRKANLWHLRRRRNWKTLCSRVMTYLSKIIRPQTNLIPKRC
mmetsp:Transcript_27402/g.40461  ORF Transcript_27402/g.40461 Transcript_27402/m.40461 type:complete len:694 (-) Transcript_27402:138-2219(-)